MCFTLSIVPSIKTLSLIPNFSAISSGVSSSIAEYSVPQFETRSLTYSGISFRYRFLFTKIYFFTISFFDFVCVPQFCVPIGHSEKGLVLSAIAFRFDTG